MLRATTLAGIDIQLDAAAVTAFKARLHGALVCPEDPPYAHARKVWNGMIDKHPALIARCTGVADVIHTVHFVRTHALPIALRCGSHNAAGHAICDGGIVADLTPMKGMRVDAAQRRVQALGGVLVEAFATLVRCAGERVYEREILREIFAAYPATSHAVDWGAGGGDLTSLMMEHFQQVYAVEPHPGMRAVLATRCPRAQILDGTLMSTVLPTQADIDLISHMFYHVPDHKWGAYTMHAAHHLTANGILIVTLKAVDSGCNQMLEHFGAPRYDLYGGLVRVMRLHPEFAFSFRRAPASITTTSFAETLQLVVIAGN